MMFAVALATFHVTEGEKKITKTRCRAASDIAVAPRDL